MATALSITQLGIARRSWCFLRPLFLLLLLSFGCRPLFAQISSSFWFDVPEVTRGHVLENEQRKVRVYLHLSATKSVTTRVKLELPAETGFHETFTIPGDGKIKISLTNEGVNIPPAMKKNWFAVPFQWGNLHTVPATDWSKYIENVLDWSETDVVNETPLYFNRTNKGVHLYAVDGAGNPTQDTPFKAFLEICCGANRDLMVFKGEAAEGTEFSIPMQTNFTLKDNRYVEMNCPPYRSFNITATEDNTMVAITVKNPIWLNTRTFGHESECTPPTLRWGKKLPAGTHNVLLAKAGQTCIVTPYEEHVNKYVWADMHCVHNDYYQTGIAESYQTSRKSDRTLEGSYVRSISKGGYSGGKIVITYQEQLVDGPNPDAIMDQLIPNDVAGVNYGIIRGDWRKTVDREFVYVVATEDNTTVTIKSYENFNPYGASLYQKSFSKTLNKNQQVSFRLRENGNDAFSLTATQPVQVFHVSGADENGGQGQRAGAVVPPLSTEQTCIGSKTVDFSRSMPENRRFPLILNIAAFQHPTDPDRQAIGPGRFQLKKSVAGGPFVDVGTSDPEYPLLTHLNDPSKWKKFPSPNAAMDKWQWTKFNCTGFQVTDASGKLVAYRLINKKNVFQLGVLNGKGEMDALYGYFSDFRKVKLEMHVKDKNDVPKDGGLIPLCRGDEVELNADTKLDYVKYYWSPETNLVYQNPEKTKVKVVNPKATTKYVVKMSGYCDFEPDAKVTIEVNPVLDPMLEMPAVLCGGGEIAMKFTELEGAKKINIRHQRENEPPLPPGYEPLVSLPLSLPNENTKEFTYKLNFPRTGHYRISALVLNGGCKKEFEQDLYILPPLAKPTVDYVAGLAPANGASNPACTPFRTQLEVTNAASYPAGTRFLWKFADGTEEIPYTTPANPRHAFRVREFHNSLAQSTMIQPVRLYVSDGTNSCRDSVEQNLLLAPLLKSKIELKASEVCQGKPLAPTSVSDGEHLTYQWEVKPQGGGASLPLSNPNGVALSEIFPEGNYKLSLTVNNGYCKDRSELPLRVYPQPRIHPFDVNRPATCYPFHPTITGSLQKATRVEWQLLTQGETVPIVLKTVQGLGGATVPLNETFTLENAGTSSIFQKIKMIAVNDDGGCKAEVERSIEVPANLNVSFFGGTFRGCPNAEGDFIPNIIAQIEGANVTENNMTWYIDGAKVSKSGNPLIFDQKLRNTDPTPKTFRIRFEAKTSGGCVKWVEEDVVVNPRLQTSWELTYTGADGVTRPLNQNDKLCAPAKAHLTATGAKKYLWEFEDGSQLEGATIEKNLDNKSDASSRYKVKLLASNDYCTEEQNFSREFELLPEIRASFIAEVKEKCNPVMVEVTNTSSPTTGLIEEWTTEGGVQDPVHTNRYHFSNSGTTGSIKLEVRNSAGCKGQATPFEVKVPKLLRAGIRDLSLDEQSFCAPGKVTFASNSSGAKTYSWDFGDGTVLPADTKERVEHEFHNTGATVKEFVIKLHVTGEVPGCDNGPAATTSVKIKVYPQVLPVSHVTTTIAPPCDKAQIRIENVSQNASDYVWIFKPDDSQNGNEEHVTSTNLATIQRELVNHATNKLVNYAVSFEASKQWPAGPKCVGKLELSPIAVPPRITPRVVVANGDKVCSDDPIPRTFANNTTGGTPDLIHEWHFGDDSDVVLSKNGESVSHTFVNRTDQDVTYNVYIVSRQPNVSNGGCRVKSDPVPVLVHPRVEAKISMNKGDICKQPLSVEMQNHTLGSEATTGVESLYQWQFGDGNRVNRHNKDAFTQDFTNDHATDAQTYKVKMTASQTHAISKLKCSSETSAELTVMPLLKAEIRVTPLELCSDAEEVSFSSTVSGGNTFKSKWDFGDGMGSNQAESKHNYTNNETAPRDFTAIYTVENEHGCSVSKTQTVKVFPRPKASFTMNWTDQCTPYEVRVTNNSSVGAKYEWTLDGDTQALPSVYDLPALTLDNQTNETKNLTLKLKVSAGICSDEKSSPLVVPPRLISEFQLSKDAGCNPVTVGFTNLSRGGEGLKYSWDLVDFGSTDEPTPADRTYENLDKATDREVKIRLTARNLFGCTATSEKTLTVWPKLDASFSATPIEGCSPLEVEYGLLESSTSHAYDYTWHIGTDFSGQHPPKQRYENPNEDATQIMRREVSLEVRLTLHPECRLSTSQNLRIFPKVVPEFTFTENGCHPLTVELRSTSKVYGSARYEWLVDGLSVGATSELTPQLENPSHTAEKEYTVTLRAISEQGCVGEQEHKIVVFPKPLANFEFRGEALHCPPYEAQIDISKTEGVNLSYAYDFGDGATETSEELTGVKHRYQNATDAEVTYQTQLEVTSANGCKDVATLPIVIYPQVRAGFHFVTQTTACSPYPVQFSNESQNASYYSWDFGDGAGDTNESPQHTFVNATDVDKTFSIKLTARSQTGCEGEVMHPLTVHAKPHAAFSVTPVTATFQDPEVPVTFVNQTQPAPATWQYRWEFGDGTGSQEQNPTPHLYKTWGDKAQGFQIPITLTVDNGPCQDVIKNFITIRAPRSEASFTSDVVAGCPPLKVLFDDRETKYANGYEWDFGDGTVSNTRRPEHIFSEPGKYNVVLTTRGDGGESTTHRLIEVYRRPEVDFKYAPESLQLPYATAQFLNLTRLGATYEWIFGDGTTSVEENPEHSYSDPGLYDITLSARSDKGCEATLEKKGFVYVSGAGYLEFPNAFAPSQSGSTGGYYEQEGERNQIFHPYNTVGIKEYKLMVFHRSGEQLFESTDLRQGWDGYFNGMLCPDGVYTWRAVGVFYDGTLFDQKGNVTLLSGK